MKIRVQIKGNKIYSPILDKMLPLSPEEEIRQEFICNLINNHGYNLAQIGQEIEDTNTNEYIDILIYRSRIDKEKKINPSIIIVIECKSDYISIDTASFKEGYNFAASNSAKIFIATNKKETKVYHIEDSIYSKLKELKSFPNADVIVDNKKLFNFLESYQSYSRDDFSRLLFKCHNIIRNNDKLSPESAFDEISKILFMKIRFERDNRKERLIFSESNLKEKGETFKQINPNRPLFQILFDQTKEYFKGESLFDINEELRIRETSFFQIVKELEQYNLSDISDDIKGIAFEQFLGRTFRGELGQFFTPRTIVNFMTEVIDPQEGELICDPCCGSGGFLIKAFEYIRSNIENEVHKEKEKLKKKLSGIKLVEYYKKLDSEFDLKNQRGRLYHFSHKCIYGTDANPRMARTAKMNMIMHGDGHGGVHHNDGLLNVNGIFDGRFDVILTNPPFGARVDKSVRVTLEDVPHIENIREWKNEYGEDYEEKVINSLKSWAEQDNGKNKPKGKAITELFSTGKFSTLTEVLFIERCLNLLKPGGRMGIVLPEGVLNNTNLQKIRDFVESRAKIILITSIPQDVFIASGATVKPSLLFFKKFTESEAKEWKRILKKATSEIFEKYAEQVKPIEEKLALRGKEAPSAKEKKELRRELQVLKEKIEIEIKAKVKKDFDYEIPIAEVEKAGISSTGAEIENELIPLCKEFTEYRRNNHLWDNKFDTISYEVMEDGKMFRIPTVGEPQEIYG
nr:N-6 DNA methylase [uncultured Draconibacterium sp.]